MKCYIDRGKFPRGATEHHHPPLSPRRLPSSFVAVMKTKASYSMLLLLTILSILVQFVHCDKGNECDGVEIVSRKEWNARNEVRHFNVKLPLNHVIILHTVTYFCKTKEQCIRNLQTVQNIHLDARGWWDVAYNFLVGGDGRIYEGRGWRKSGAHSVNFNTNSLGIAFIGNYEKYPPTDSMVNATLNLIKCGVEKGYLTPTREIHGHKDVACTLSPGKYLYAVIRQWDNYKGGRLPLYNCQTLGIPVVDWDQLDY